MITTACRDCEERDIKDIVYTVGSIDKDTNSLRYIWMVYGDCYAASSEIYERIADKISEGVNGVP
jgi:NgoPII restriction endonuclease